MGCFRPLASFLLLAALAAAQDEAMVRKAQQGKDLMGAGRFAEAAVLYEELNRSLPGTPGLMLNLGMAYHMSGQDKKAIPVLKQAVERDAALAPAWLFLGASLARSGDPAGAIDPLKKYLKPNPRDVSARQILAQALFDTGRLEEAAAEFRSLHETNPQEPGFLFGLGKAYEGLAQQLFEKLPDEGPQSAYFLSLIGETRLLQQQYRAAFFFYRQALEREPGLRGVHATVAQIYKLTGKPEWMEAELAKEAALGNPDCAKEPLVCSFLRLEFLKTAELAGKQNTPEAIYWRIKAYNELATETFAKLQALPPSLEQHTMLGEIRRAQGRYQEALDHWKAATEAAPEDPGLQKELAFSYYLAGQFPKAEELLKKFAAAEPKDPELQFLLGDTYLNAEKAAAAIPHLTESLRLGKDDLQIRSSLGRALVAAGKPAEAVPHLEKTLEADTDGSAHYQLSRALQAAGQAERAREMVRRYQEIRKRNQAVDQEIEQEVQITAP